MMKYNYVFFQPSYDYYRITYSDLAKYEGVEYVDQYPKYGGELIRTLCRIHRSPKLNRFVYLPLKRVWNPFFFKNNFTDERPICFLFSAGCAYLKDYGFVDYLKNKYPSAKFVCFYQDIVESVKSSKIEDVLNLFDLVLSYDYEDSKKYNLLFHNTVFSDFKVNDNNKIIASDIYFVGAAKNRLQQLLDIYYKLKSLSLSCDFNIIGVPESKQVKGFGLHYIDHMSYVENLQHVVKTKVVLEVLQKRASGASLRMWECINYDKILLSNNEHAHHIGCFDSVNMHMISEIDDILQWINKPCTYTQSQKDSIRPIKLIEFIDGNL